MQVNIGLEPDLIPKNSLFSAKNDTPTVPTGVALLFGCERFGMGNADVYRCHVALQIPTNPDFGSLNLAAAVQLLAYDWQQALSQVQPPALDIALVKSSEAAPAVADAAAIAGVLAHWQQALEAIGFLDPQAPKKLMPRLNQLLNRSGLQAEEVHILRGIAKAVLAMQKNARAAEDVPATLRPCTSTTL